MTVNSSQDDPFLCTRKINEQLNAQRHDVILQSSNVILSSSSCCCQSNGLPSFSFCQTWHFSFKTSFGILIANESWHSNTKAEVKICVEKITPHPYKLCFIGHVRGLGIKTTVQGESQMTNECVCIIGLMKVHLIKKCFAIHFNISFFCCPVYVTKT